MESRKAQRELILNVALPMARLDQWGLEQLEADLKSGKIEGSYAQNPPNMSYLKPQKGADGDYALPIPPGIEDEGS